jgi:hypothetical protein
MSATIWVAVAALAGSVIAAFFTWLASRKSSDDSRAIGLINAGQVSLEAALRRATDEIVDARAQIAQLRAELASVRIELDRALQLHANCERERVREAHELAALRIELGKKPPNE